MTTIIETTYGKIRGMAERGLEIFRGVPFAQPPVGELRFRAPQPPEPWSGVRDAMAFGPSAPQGELMLQLPGMDIGPTSEDCLYLNIYTSATDGARRPVLFWIHGGGFVVGSGSQALYNGEHLARRGDVVVVTINYRLGPLGFLYLADLCPDLEGAIGNEGLRDQLAALEWVRDNIAAFGGDPNNVTIFGESAGGMAVATLLAMPAARGLFAKAIAQSGAARNCHSRESATRVAEVFIEELGLNPAEIGSMIRHIPAQQLLDTHQQTMFKLGFSLRPLPFQPVVDGDSLPESPLNAIRAGVSAHVPLMTGTNRDEFNLFGALAAAGFTGFDESVLMARLAVRLPDCDLVDLVATYRRARQGRLPTDPLSLYFAIETDLVFRMPAIHLAEAQAAHQPKTFMYLVTWESPLLAGQLGACHAVELPLVFGNLDAIDVPELAELAGNGPEAQALSAKMMDAWIAFARNGDPGHGGLEAWSPYDTERRATMQLGGECKLEEAPQETERRAMHGLA